MRLYDHYLLPRLIDCVCGAHAIDQRRQRVVRQAAGRVLEIGFGSGLNLPHYDRRRVECLWALEPSAEMRALAAPRVAASGLDVRWLDVAAEGLPLPDGSVDCVVVTFSLCTIPDPAGALAQVRRVLRTGGMLLFCEHGLAPDPAVQRWQRRLDGVWGRLAGGCHLDRDPRGLIEGAGFEVEDGDSAYLPRTPRLAGFVSCGRAWAGAARQKDALQRADTSQVRPGAGSK